MSRTKKLIAAGALTLGIGAGAVLFTPNAINASSNVVLASVDWVTSQLNPMKSKITELESKLASQQQEINNLKSQIGNPTTPPAEGQLPSAVYVTKSSVNIHSGASTDYKVVATKAMGSSLKVIDSFKASTGLWYRVELSSTLKGWVFSGNVSIDKPSTAAPSQVITTGDVHLRKGATTSYGVIQTLPKGTVLKYISTFVNSKGETWYNAQTSSGVKGWVFGGLSEVR
ncbi:peptide-binding protein [Paenibacillus sp. FSL R5-0490]|uniref:SH3 domain-containing protein n=1 Tax=Bacillales TaxID=1385 RepID=UPI00096F2ABC|nr:SH3 domain-containing protein [Paenibacillus sp. FSL R5-0490]OMF61496.1 peptide-binding protein [Paenibacillus sp. FSL R5-0490]